MATRDGFGHRELVHLLLVVVVAELVLNRMAVEALRPEAGAHSPAWNRVLDYSALFSFYFASALAIAVLAVLLWVLVRRDPIYGPLVRDALGVTGAFFGLLAVASIAINPPPTTALAVAVVTAIALLGLVTGHSLWRRPRRYRLYPSSLYYGFLLLALLVAALAAGEISAAAPEQCALRAAIYLAVVVPASLLVWRLWGARPRSDLAWYASLFVLAAGLLLAVSLPHVTLAADVEGSFALETAFTVFLVALVLAQLSRPGDPGPKVGVALLAAPLVIHYMGPLTEHLVAARETGWTWSDRVVELGTWAMVLAGIAAPFCFCPRPVSRALTRVAPIALGAFVGTAGAILLRAHEEVGMKLATWGVGVPIGPAPPTHHIALYLIAIAAMTWALVSCLVAEAPARRHVGVGIALVIASGYAFKWPMQLVVGAIGLFTMSHAASRASGEERTLVRTARGFRAPPIPDEVWQSYIAALLDALKTAGTSSAAVTVRGDEELATTHVTTSRRGLPLQLRFERLAESLQRVDILCGEEPQADDEPAWTLYARPERLLRVHEHEQPPPTSAPASRTGDHAFDLRFRVRDRGVLTESLLDEGLRARAIALVDGWMAYWPKRALHYRVHPGQGAPLDHPIPITELAFRGTGTPPAVDKLMRVVELITDIAGRGLGDGRAAR